MKQNVAIYGGSFDPPHLGHMMVVTHLLLNDPSIDLVWVVPCFQHADKNLTSFEHRVAMCVSTFRGLPRTIVSRIEEYLGGVSYSVRTIRHYADYKPDWNLRFIMGSDLKDQAPTWEGWETIARLAPPLYVGRAGISPVEAGDPTPISPIVSSTIVRKALSEQNYDEAERYLHRDVLTLIQKNKLYVK